MIRYGNFCTYTFILVYFFCSHGLSFSLAHPYNELTSSLSFSCKRKINVDSNWACSKNSFAEGSNDRERGEKGVCMLIDNHYFFPQMPSCNSADCNELSRNTIYLWEPMKHGQVSILRLIFRFYDSLRKKKNKERKIVEMCEVVVVIQ